MWAKLSGLTMAMVLAGTPDLRAGEYVTVPGAEAVHLHYEQAGSGRPVVVVPGWTMTTRFFEGQLAGFAGSADLRLVVVDPRAQGRSSKVAEGASYTRHAQDLRAVIEALELDRPVLVGWSWGAMAAYAYVEQFGQDSISGLVLIDNPPKPLTETDPPGWTDGDRAAVRGFADAVVADQLGTARDFIPWMFTRDLTPEEHAWMLSETMLTPAPVAAQLLYDGWMGDHRETLAGLGIPVLHVVRAENEAVARALLAGIHPASEVAAFGGHAMFHEFPERFNALLAEFVARLP